PLASLAAVNCPVDNEILQMTERQGVEVDYCPRCRGVWLDRGELDKILERASAEMGGGDRYDDDRPRRGDDDRYRDGERNRDDRSRDDRHQDRPYKKKKSFLSEMFEID
ncbi:MAG TPA: zf-TFIIB domain-containing protein, partial [Acidimicrobiales bacterium]|nr:zf-TFIIB domain-containing protein [Acidimicrobiales bacterium]